MFRFHDGVETQAVGVAGGSAEGCDNWIDWYGKKACTIEHFWEAVGVEAESKAALPVPSLVVSNS